MNIAITFFVIFLVMGIVFMSGCTSNTNMPKTQEQAQKAVVDVSSDVQDVQNILQDIDNSFG